LNTLGSGTLAAITEAISFRRRELVQQPDHLILRIGVGDFVFQSVDRGVEPSRA